MELFYVLMFAYNATECCFLGGTQSIKPHAIYTH
jgi:hypothetical protein